MSEVQISLARQYMDDIQLQGYGSSEGRQAYEYLHSLGWQDWNIRVGYYEEPVAPEYTYSPEDIEAREGEVVWNQATYEFDDPVVVQYVPPVQVEAPTEEDYEYALQNLLWELAAGRNAVDYEGKHYSLRNGVWVEYVSTVPRDIDYGNVVTNETLAQMLSDQTNNTLSEVRRMLYDSQVGNIDPLDIVQLEKWKVETADLLRTTVEDYLEEHNQEYIDYITYIEEMGNKQIIDAVLDKEDLGSQLMQPEAKERIEEVMTHWEEDHSYVSNIALPKLTETIKVVLANLPTTQASVNLVEWIQGMQADLNSDEFRLAIDKISAVANVLEMGAISYGLAGAAFAPRTRYDPTSGTIKTVTAFEDFNLSLTEFRTLLNLFNTVAGSTQFYGAYSGRSSLWSYSTKPGPGFIKSRFGDYYVRKKLS